MFLFGGTSQGRFGGADGAGETEPIHLTDCDAPQFKPTIAARATADRPDAPTGLDLELRFPQRYQNPEGLETPPLRDAIVTLPEGMGINPAAADGLGACPDSQLNFRSTAAMSACWPTTPSSARRSRAKAEFTGQNGKRSVSRPLAKVDCGKGRS